MYIAKPKFILKILNLKFAPLENREPSYFPSVTCFSLLIFTPKTPKETLKLALSIIKTHIPGLKLRLAVVLVVLVSLGSSL